MEYTINLPASKSESNRCLIIKALTNGNFDINNLSEADDTQILNKILVDFKVKNSLSELTFDVGHAGTVMRFLTAFFSIQEEGNVILTGSERMQKRPIKILVDALNCIGADISYLNNNGFPPVFIKGKKLSQNKVSINASVSSQYISALLLIAPTLPNGLELQLTGKQVSSPYVKMTLDIMQHFGIKSFLHHSTIVIKHQLYQPCNISIENDWSAASYWYEFVALSSANIFIKLPKLYKNSRQGDSVLPRLFSSLGINTQWYDDGIILSKKENYSPPQSLYFNLIETPDLAQTIICTCAGLDINTKIDGLSTLTIKETDRLLALQKELKKFRINSSIINNNSFELYAGDIALPSEEIKTYNDHRMAMAFAPLQLKTGCFSIENPDVVKKSYPNFWKEWEKLN